MVVSNGHQPDPRVQKEAEALAAVGWSVEVHAFDRAANMPAYETMNGINIIRHRVGATPYGGTVRTGLGLGRFRRTVIRALRADAPAIVHCHDADTLAVGVAMERHGSRLVFDMHDLQHTWLLMPSPHSVWRRLASRLMCKRMLSRARRADLVITSSGGVRPDGHPGFREWLADRGIPANGGAATVIENRPKVPDSTAPTPEKTTIGYIGTVREASMFSDLIDSLRLMPTDSRPAVRVAGRGVAQEQVSGMFAEASDIDSKVTGAFSNDEIPALMADVSIMYCVYPTGRGNIPEGAIATKMFDAAAHGRPSLVNSDCLMADIASDESLGCSVSPSTPSSLLDKLQTMLTDPPEISLDPDWTEQAERLVAAYSGLRHD